MNNRLGLQIIWFCFWNRLSTNEFLSLKFYYWGGGSSGFSIVLNLLKTLLLGGWVCALFGLSKFKNGELAGWAWVLGLGKAGNGAFAGWLN